MPQAIISVSMEHMLFIISIVVPSAGIIMHFMPLSVIEQVMWHIIGIIDATGIEPIIGADIGMDMADFMSRSRSDNQRC